FVEVLEYGIGGAILPDEFGGGFFTDAGDARHVIYGIAVKRLDFHGLPGRVTKILLHFGGIEEGIGLDIVHAGAAVQQLPQILVARDQNDVIALVTQAMSHGGHEGVGLEAGEDKEGDAGIADDLEDAFLLDVEVGGLGLAIGLVLGEEFLAE